jgi:hypothetical protein
LQKKGKKGVSLNAALLFWTDYIFGVKRIAGAGLFDTWLSAPWPSCNGRFGLLLPANCESP